jgi:hypothetical protein
LHQQSLEKSAAGDPLAKQRQPTSPTAQHFQYKGVFRGRRLGQWRAQIGKNGKNVHLGVFPTRQAAHAAYVAAARKHYGEFARAD